MIEVRYVDGVEDGIDFDAAYTIAGWSGVAWRLLGWAQQWEQGKTLITLDEDGEYDPDGEEVEVDSDEGELIDNRDRVVAVMIGDDTRHEFDKTDAVVIPDDSFCRGCGQVGCTAEVYA